MNFTELGLTGPQIDAIDCAIELGADVISVEVDSWGIARVEYETLTHSFYVNLNSEGLALV